MVYERGWWPFNEVDCLFSCGMSLENYQPASVQAVLRILFWNFRAQTICARHVSETLQRRKHFQVVKIFPWKTWAVQFTKRFYSATLLGKPCFPYLTVILKFLNWNEQKANFGVKVRFICRYLTADQLVGPSAVEAYIRALKRGCRCVECKSK